MPITQDRLTKLRNFGLSEYAARAYLALLDLGTAEARDVSSISKVPQAKIYHVLEQLHEKGLVVILPEFPKKYVPVPFEDYLQRLFDEHTKAAEAIDSERDELAEMFAVVGDTDVGNRGFFTVIRGRRNVLSKVEEMIQATKRDLLILGTAGTASRAQHMVHELGRAKERGVRVRVLAPIDAETLPKLEKIANRADVRARDLLEEDQSRKVAIVVSDGERAFLIHYVPDDANLYAGKDIGVFTDQEAMVAAIRAIVEPHWAGAADIAAKRAEIVEGREAEYARVYTSQEDVRAALERAVAAGVKEACAVVAHPLTSAGEVSPMLERVAKAGGRFRALLNVPTVAAADALGGLADAGEVRHLAPRLVTRQWILDDREAFFSVAGRDAEGGDAAGELVIHTNHRAVIASMRRHFEALWGGALPLRTRRQELEAFPHLQPGDLGLGVLFSQIEDAVLVCDAHGRIVLWNPAASRVFGRTLPDVLESRAVDLAEPRHAETLERALRRALAAAPGTPEARTVVETTCVRADGRRVEVEWVVSPIVDASAHEKLALAIGRDITDGKRVLEAEVRTNMQVVRVYERMTEAFYALDRDWRFTYRNPVTRQMQHSLPDERIDGQVLWDVFPDLVGTKFETEFRRAMRDMTPVRFEERYPRMDRWFEVHAYPSEDGLSVYFRDVTARRQADADLRAREEQLAQAEILAGIGSWSWDVADGQVSWSPGLRRILGVDAAEASSFDAWLGRLHPEDRPLAQAVLARAMETREPFEFRHRVVRPDGEVRVLVGRGKVVAGADGRPARFVGTAQDVTDDARAAEGGVVPVIDGDARAAPPRETPRKR